MPNCTFYKILRFGAFCPIKGVYKGPMETSVLSMQVKRLSRVLVLPGMGEGEIKNDGGDEFNYDNSVRTFVNVTMNPQHMKGGREEEGRKEVGRSWWGAMARTCNPSWAGVGVVAEVGRLGSEEALSEK
jgi:hypothetical protein